MNSKYSTDMEEIEALKSQNAALREALKLILWKLERKEVFDSGIDWAKIDRNDIVIKKARELLTPAKG
jgi:hypothetical protein